MKKIIIAVFALMGMSQLSAQESEIRFGAKAGLNIANLVGDGVADGLDSKLGFHIGGLVEVPVSEKLAIQPELMFSTQGVKVDIGNFEQKSNVNYLNLPLMAKYYVAEGFSLQVGPQLGFLVSAESKTEVEGQSPNTIDIKDGIKSIDFGVNFGIGYQLESSIFFDVRYNLGLSNTDDFFDDSDFPVKNSVFQISVGYKF